MLVSSSGCWCKCWDSNHMWILDLGYLFIKYTLSFLVFFNKQKATFVYSIFGEWVHCTVKHLKFLCLLSIPTIFKLFANNTSHQFGSQIKLRWLIHPSFDRPDYLLCLIFCQFVLRVKIADNYEKHVDFICRWCETYGFIQHPCFRYKNWKIDHIFLGFENRS